MAGQAADQDQQEHRDVKPQEPQRKAVEHDRADHEKENAEVVAADSRRRGAPGYGAHHDYGAHQRQHDTQPEREVSRSHPGCGSHGVLGGLGGETSPQGDEHDTGPEALFICYQAAISLSGAPA
ncbi:hypothetical protein D3C85_1411630 [compost metagenome]